MISSSAPATIATFGKPDRPQIGDAFGVLTLDEAYRAISFDTIILLFGMMSAGQQNRFPGK